MQSKKNVGLMLLSPYAFLMRSKRIKLFPLKGLDPFASHKESMGKEANPKINKKIEFILKYYQIEHKTSPPIPRKRASRSVRSPCEVDNITIPIPPKIFGISF